MHRLSALALALALSASPALAQLVPPPPELQGRIPAPLAPPPKPPVINGPLGQQKPPGVYRPRSLRTHGDRTVGCLHSGAGYGLKGADLDAYTRSCANAN